MENNTCHDSNPEFTRPKEPELDLYTIPSHSTRVQKSWDIYSHEIIMQRILMKSEDPTMMSLLSWAFLRTLDAAPNGY
ncbi:hypothetical protein CCACVL1_24202 [Corchorus capsularis]|uniref:Uncharacterized protein n=1 Tax=Corchorus capsularis TaxID=210143 RepID=A0A1R3GQI7_COCAP|nr:hypothetical protein CCACVL1_24202 [Corchorus capsularis]